MSEDSKKEAEIQTTREETHFVRKLSPKEQIDILHPRAYNFHRNNIFNRFVFSPEDIELKDDAFHGSPKRIAAEWWYFDAILNNGYSIQLSISVFNVMKHRFATVGLNIYKNGLLEANKVKKYSMDNFHISADTPSVVIDGKEVMKGYINQTTREWIYDISLELEGLLVDLQFIGCAKGWKGRVSSGGWAVILPKANVSGKIKVNGIEKDVVGTGYHDHNWDITLRMGMNFGWHWGKIISTNLTIIWFMIMNTRRSGQPLLVINKGKDHYINIEPENTHFIAGDFSRKNLRQIPHSFILKADTQNASLQVNLTAIGVHRVLSSGIVNYWRYHLKSQGSITVDSQMENINGTAIAEFMRFR